MYSYSYPIMIKKIYWKLPFKFFRIIYKFRNKENIDKHLHFMSHGKLILVINKKSKQSKIFLAKRTRLHLYWHGIDSRLEQIARQYMLEQVTSLASGTGWIVDIGANIGEFSLTLKNNYNRNRFILIEPSIAEYAAAVQNMQDVECRIFCTGLWYKDTELPFYHANETGDSSLLPSNYSRPHDLILVRTLDSLLSEINVGEIDLLKLEAEGAEPEILLGAEKTLKITKYVTADLGPERGVDQSRVYEQCYALLLKSGFEEISRFKGKREVYLFKNTKNFHE